MVALIVCSLIVMPARAMPLDEAVLPQISLLEVDEVTPSWGPQSLDNYSKFHLPSEVADFLYSLEGNVSDLVDVSVIGQSVQGRDIHIIRVTNENSDVPKAKALVVAHHHGREQITVEVSLRFLLRLVNNYGTDESITEFINSQEIFIIPTLNPDALQMVIADNHHFLRKNLRLIDDDGDGLVNEDPREDVDGDGTLSSYDVYQKTTAGGLNYLYTYYEGIDNDGDGLLNEDDYGSVDLNRNYDYHWNDSSAESGWGSDTTTQTYPGTAPFSEPETQAFRDFALKHRFSAAYSLHSGINASYFPLTPNNQWPEPYLYNSIYNDLQAILPPGFFSNAMAEQRMDSALAGGWAEWMYFERGTVVPVTYELYRNTTSLTLEETIIDNSTHRIMEWKGIYPYFNPLPPYIDNLWQDIHQTFDYWLGITPRLEVQNYSYSGGSNIGDSVTVTVTAKNLSPRLSSVDWVGLYDEELSELDSKLPLKAGQTATDEYTFSLPHSLVDQDLVLFIGNEYLGYRNLVVSLSNPSSSGGEELSSTGEVTDTESTASGFPVGVLLLVTLPIFVTVRRKRS